MTVFCSRATIVVGQCASPGADVVTVSDLADGSEQIDGDRFDVTEDAVREVLSTPLFSGRGPERLGFAHRTYAEFLAARYVSRRRLDATQVGSLIFHPECETRVVPQLSETAAWIAVNDSGIFDRMMSGDPQTLLRSDVATADDRVKSELVARLLHGLQAGELDDSEWGLRDHYAKLSHSTLANQLEPIIRDKTLDVVVRRFAVDVAEECDENKVLNALTETALDQSDDPHIRAQASYAIVRIGDDDACRRLKPLALGQAGPDPDDELRGSALRGVWQRRLITAAELFANMTRPQRDSLGGAYRSFLNNELTKHLIPNDLAVALKWCSQQPAACGARDDFEDAVSEIVLQSLSHLDNPDVLDAFADYVVSRIRQRDELEIEADAYESLEAPDRRKIIATVIPKLDDPKENMFGLIFGRPALIHDDDLEWLLERSTNAGSPEEKRVWAELARRRFNYGPHGNLNEILDCCQSNAVAAEVFADLIQPVELDSDAADKMRAEYLRHLEFEEWSLTRRESPLLDPPPAERVEACLERFEAGRLNAWWQLNQELQLDAHSTRYLHDLNDDLTQFPGWIAADDETKQRIVTAAGRYLSEWHSKPDDWIATRQIHYPDFAGYRALVLVEKFDPTILESMSAEPWSNVAPSILGFPTNPGFGTDSEERQKRLIGDAYRQASDTVIDVLIKLIEGEDKRDNLGHLFVLSRIDHCKDQRMTDALLQKARDRTLQPSSVADLIESLMERDPVRAELLARALVINGCSRKKLTGTAHCRVGVGKTRSTRTRQSRPCSYQRPASRGHSSVNFDLLSRKRSTAEKRSVASRYKRARGIARQLAVVLWINGIDRWSTLWPQFQRDRRFFRDVMLEVAREHRQSRKYRADNYCLFLGTAV